MLKKFIKLFLYRKFSKNYRGEYILTQINLMNKSILMDLFNANEALISSSLMHKNQKIPSKNSAIIFF